MSLIQMSSCLENTNHDPNDCNDPIPEVDFNDETYDDDDDDEDLYVEEERMLFIKSLKPVGNSFALVRKSNGDPTFLMYEGLSDGEDCVYDPDRRVTRSFTRKSRGSNSFSHSVSPSGLDKKRENDHNRGAGTNRVGLNFSSRSVCRPRRIRNRSVVKKVDGDGRLGEGDKMVRGLAKRQRNDRDSGADPRKVGSNCLPYYLRPRRKQKPSVSEKVSDDGLSGKIDRVVRGLAKKHSNDQDNGADTGEVSFNCLSQNVTRRSNRNRNVVKNVGGDCSDRVNKWRAKGSNVDTRRSRRGLANGDYSSKVDKWRARLSGSKYRSGLGKKRKNDNGDKIESSCIVEAQGGQDNGAEKEGNICIMGTQRDQGNCAEKELNCKIEPQDDQDYADSNRAYGIWLRNYMEKTCDFENNNVETSSDELEVLDKDPQCSEWKYTPVADSNVLDASVLLYLNLVVVVILYILLWMKICDTNVYLYLCIFSWFCKS